MNRVRQLVILFLIATAFIPSQSSALINPSLQVMDFCRRYSTVANFKLTSVDEDKRVATLTLQTCSKGKWKTKTVTLSAPDKKFENAFLDLISEDETLVAFIGKTRRGKVVNEVLFYTADGRWQTAMIDDPTKPEAWRWTRDLKDSCFGTFNGRADRLFEITQQHSKGRYYFPAKPFTKFGPDIPVGKLPGPARGVALYDIDADGDLDIYACSPAGNRMYIQTGPMKFEDKTSALGLDGVKSSSVNVADVNGDGKADILAGSVILLATKDNSYKRINLLSAAADAKLKMAFFAEINGDGFPDVVMSIRKGGLRLFLNKGVAPFTLTEITEKSGLKAKTAGATCTGYAFAGDWNADGRTDLFYAVKGGLILVQDKTGRFAHNDYDLGYEFTSVHGQAGACGGGAFAPLWRGDKYDIISTRDIEIVHLLNDGKHAQEMNDYGNEITEGTRAMLAVLAEDLNADGLVDVYATTRSKNPNIFFANRGHGSFMASHKYDKTIFPGKSHQQGSWGASAGDINGDGAIDLCLTRVNGDVTLMMNDALRSRRIKNNLPHHEKLRAGAGYATIAVVGRRGVLGAEIQLIDSKNRIVSRRTIGGNTGTGCRGPDSATLAVMQPGQYIAVVRFSDGAKQKAPITIKTGKHKLVRIERQNRERPFR